MVQCAYHPNSEAVAKCERCGRPICVLDKNIYRKRKHYGDDTYVETYEYCPVCYSDAQIRDAQSSMVGGVIFIGIILIFILPNFLGMFDISGFFASFIFIAVFIAIALFVIGPSKISQAKNKQKSFLNSLQSQKQAPIRSQPITMANRFKKKSNVEVVCFQCGSPLSLEDSFCSSCGDSTEDERKFY